LGRLKEALNIPDLEGPDAVRLPDGAYVGDTESDPKSDIVGQASLGIRTDQCLDFLA